ncbi:hypothetical protein LSH36_1368g00050 [Paralvinella palmiformis]|uniref:2Fe-2S ferredoxin-type domain-containing protein n=1 Tax=Paralvinella palmiformis TaxID=53620 RepID=A0AAD9MNG0_9ANNE|nr:hypothetical protein LSH36_1368g00050 [Paralvinella palmiformis]
MALPPGDESATLIFYVNGQKIVEENPDPEETLLKYLRRKHAVVLLTGTKLSCGQGACGSCTVMVSRYDRKSKQIRHAAVVSCLVPVCSLHGLAVTTIEGEQLVKAHGTQCGYCTPGFVMSMYTLLHNNPIPSMDQVQKAILGNLCRCTGYRPILDGFKPFTKDYCPLGDQCCKRTSSSNNSDESMPVNPLSDHPESDGVGRPIVHRSARQQATGEALFIDDTPHYENELYLSLVTSKYGHARILKVDPSEALRVNGVVDVITHKNIPGKNQYGQIKPDEVVFAVEEVEFYGQIIAAVIATTEDIAKRAAELVDVTYQPLPCITTIQEAIKADSYLDNCKKLRIGDTASGFIQADEIVQGEIEMGGQEHFYMETMRALVVPSKEDNQLNVFAPVQNGKALQEVISHVLDIPYSTIGVHTKRIGGSFGGKGTKLLVVLPVALAAHRLKRPVRCILDRDTDMQITGGRHPVLAQYKILEVLLLGFDNCYQIRNVQINGRLCKTNLPSNTAMRGFGNPQTICIVETWMQHVAERLNLNPEQVRELNMYKSGEIFPFNGNPETSTFERTWNEVKSKSDFQVRSREVEEFNRYVEMFIYIYIYIYIFSVY